MRAGLLSNPCVIAQLQTNFLPVHISALNTPECMHDPRDVATLASFATDDTDRFQGGEREAFVRADGTMGTVFLSLSGSEVRGNEFHCSQYTAPLRRDDSVVRLFRYYGAVALRTTNDALPSSWRELWDPEHPLVTSIASALPRWPEPRAGEQGFRVFVRNSYRMYDDLHGSQLALVDGPALATWTQHIAELGIATKLPEASFRALADAMVPRGGVDTRLDDASIAGDLLLRPEAIEGPYVVGTLQGSFALTPTRSEEAGRRPSAAWLFHSKGQLVGRFRWNRENGQFEQLRVVADQVDFSWDPPDRDRPDYHAPRHQIAFEWVFGRAESPR